MENTKIEAMVVSRNNENSQINIFISGKKSQANGSIQVFQYFNIVIAWAKEQGV